jgi:hypothetical protein
LCFEANEVTFPGVTNLAELADVTMHSVDTGHMGLEVALLGCLVVAQVAGILLSLNKERSNL